MENTVALFFFNNLYLNHKNLDLRSYKKCTEGFY